jgi:hypothetical protein
MLQQEICRVTLVSIVGRSKRHYHFMTLVE